MERARNLAEQKPWIGLLVAAPVSRRAARARRRAVHRLPGSHRRRNQPDGEPSQPRPLRCHRRRRRFDEAREVTTVAPPAIDSEGGLLLPRLWPTVTVSWPSPVDRQRTESVEYHPLWAGPVRQPITVRTDAAGVITSAGLDLEGWRCTLWGLALAMALFTTPVVARGLVRMARRWRTLQRALGQPRLEFLPITRLDVQKQNAIPVGVRCEVRDESGRIHSAFFSSDRPPLKDESGAKVLAVTPRGEPLAEPVLVADDGYPFVIG